MIKGSANHFHGPSYLNSLKKFQNLKPATSILQQARSPTLSPIPLTLLRKT